MDQKDKSAEILSLIEEKLEQKRTEAISIGGGARVLEEMLDIHRSHIKEIKTELTTLVEEGKVPMEVANFTLSYVERSHNKIKDVSGNVKKLSDIRSGEVLAHDSLLKSIKQLTEKSENKPVDDFSQITPGVMGETSVEEERIIDLTQEPLAEAEQAAPREQKAEEPEEVAAAVPKRRKPRAQEKSKKIDDTVKRLKTRRNSDQ